MAVDTVALKVALSDRLLDEGRDTVAAGDFRAKVAAAGDAQLESIIEQVFAQRPVEVHERMEKVLVGIARTRANAAAQTIIDRGNATLEELERVLL